MSLVAEYPDLQADQSGCVLGSPFISATIPWQNKFPTSVKMVHVVFQFAHCNSYAQVVADVFMDKQAVILCAMMTKPFTAQCFRIDPLVGSARHSEKAFATKLSLFGPGSAEEHFGAMFAFERMLNMDSLLVLGETSQGLS